MKSVASLLVCFATLSGLLAAAHLLQPPWLAQVGLDFWVWQELSTRVGQEQQRAENLANWELEVQQRLTAKEQVVHQLTDGRIGLREAVARFRSLNERKLNPTLSEPETYQQLRAWVHGANWWRQPGETPGLLARLDAEARNLWGCDDVASTQASRNQP